MNKELDLWEHQKKAVDRAKGLREFALFFEVGTGKTLTAIHILKQKCNANRRLLRSIIFGPPVVLEAWRREIQTNSKEAMHKNVHVLSGTGKKRVETFKKLAFSEEGGEKFAEGKIFITNYHSLLMPDLFELFKDWQPELLIFDESHKLKNRQAKTTKAAIKLSDIASHKFLLTGTPIVNKPMDIWSQYRILDGGATFDKNFSAFRAEWFTDRNDWMPKLSYFPNWQPKQGFEQVFNALIYKKAARALKKDCLDLPPIVNKKVFVELSPDQAKMYNQMEKTLVAYMDDKACVAEIALTKMLRLMQMLSGFYVDDEDNVHSFKKNPKLDALLDLVWDICPDEKIIIWSTFKHSYKQIIEAIDARKGCDAETKKELANLKLVTLVGGMTDKARQSAIDDFRDDPDTRIMLANQAAGGTGVNLISASCMIYYSRNYSLEQEMQSEARCHRGGSEIHEKITRIDIIAPQTLDEVVLDALSRKENMAENIMRIRDEIKTNSQSRG